MSEQIGTADADASSMMMIDTESKQGQQGFPFQAEESLIGADDPSNSLNANVRVGRSTAAGGCTTSKGDSTMIGLENTATFEESCFSSPEGMVSKADNGQSLADGMRKIHWMAIALFLLIVAAASISTFLVVKAPLREKDSLAQASQLELGDIATFPPTDSFSASPSSITASRPTMSPYITSHLPPSTWGPTDQPTNKQGTPILTLAPEVPPTMSPTSLVVSSTPSPLTPSQPIDRSTAPSSVEETYIPGNLTRQEVGLLLSEGLRARIIATSGKPVQYSNGTFSTIPFHSLPDFGATFPDTRPFNKGGWVYTSNSEMKEEGQGGVGSLTFNNKGNIIDYRMALENTTMNCGGGSTPWGTWVSCEEVEFFGQIYQVDPFGEIPAQPATIGSQLGRWESFAYDVRDPLDPKFFATEDHNKGTVRRFRPEKSMIDWDNPWNMLHVNGTIDYLVIHPNKNVTGGTFEWVDDIQLAKNNARSFYPQTEGIDVYDGIMYVACKGVMQLFMFDLDALTYSNHSTVSGLFDGSPDQLKRIMDDNPSDLLYLTEDGGENAGVHARDENGRYFTVLEGPAYMDDATGLAFSPDGKHLYIAFQKNGILFDVWREDGLSFGSKTLNVKYHSA